MSYDEREIGTNWVPPIPDFARAAAAAETETIVLLRERGQAAVEEIKGAIHSRTGTEASAISVSVGRLAGGGVRLVFGEIRKATFATRKGPAGQEAKRQYVFHGRFINSGTGIYGPRGSKIKRKGLIQVGGQVMVPSGDGQKPQHMFDRARESFLAAEATMDSAIEAAFTRAITVVRR